MTIEEIRFKRHKILDAREERLQEKLNAIQRDIESIKWKRERLNLSDTICPLCKGTGTERIYNGVDTNDADCTSCQGYGVMTSECCPHCRAILSVQDLYDIRHNQPPWSIRCPKCHGYLSMENGFSD